MPPVYLDYAAATPLDDRVRAAMEPYLTDEFYNPSATYSGARRAKNALEEARVTVAACIGARPSEIIFTAGGTEANNLAIHGVMRRYPNANMVISAIEHSATGQPAAHYSPRVAPVNDQGILDVDAATRLISEDTVLVSCMYANNEIGTIQPVRELTAAVQIIRKQRLREGSTLPLYVHVDACQAPNYLDVHAARLGADLITLNGSKMYGPKQSGVLFVKGGIVLAPLIEGGGQEGGLRSGTENLAGIIGFATALELATTMRHEESKRLQSLQQHWYKQLAAQLPKARINGSRSRRLPNNIHLTLPGHDNERLLISLDEAGVMAAAGSACSASSQTPSAVLAAIGLNDEAARSSLRFTMGRGTTQADVDRTIEILARIASS